MSRLVNCLALVATVALAACSSTEKPKPTALEAIAPQISGRLVWSTRVDVIQFPLAVTVRDGNFIVAGGDGSVVSLEAATGREQWRGQAGRKLSAGVGSDGRYAAVVTVDNELVVLDRGNRIWSAPLQSRTTTAPLVAGERVFVVGVDRLVHAFDALDGRRLWTYKRSGEPLTLAQPAVLAAYKNTLLVGQGASLVGVEPLKGAQSWDVAVTSPRGTNEVERLNDLVGPALRVGDTICARAFQTAVGCIAANTHTLRWSRLNAGQQALGGDAELVFGADASDRITAWRASNGDTAWTNERLLYRGLSAPLSVGKAVVFGDIEGQVHFLSREDGKTLLRLPTDGSAVVAQPVASAGTVLVATRSGGLFAFRTD